MERVYDWKRNVLNAYSRGRRWWLKVRIQLPNGERIYLDENLDIEERFEIVYKLLEDWEDLIETNWNNTNIIFFLDGLSNYLVWHKEEEDKGSEDKYIMSIKKVEQMIGRRKASSVPFSSLPISDRERIIGEERRNGYD